MTTLCGLLGTLPHGWSVFLSSRMLNWASKGFSPWLRWLQQSRYVRLLVWWMSVRAINLWCNPWMMEPIVVSGISLSEPLISSLYVPSQGLYTFFHWRHSQTARAGTWVTWLTWTFSVCFTCGLFDWMLELFVAALHRHLMSILSGCLNFGYGSCASLCIIDVSKDAIVKNILEINGTVQKTVETIIILRTNLKETSTVNHQKWINKFLKCRENAISSLNASKHGGRTQITRSDSLWRM